MTMDPLETYPAPAQQQRPRMGRRFKTALGGLAVAAMLTVGAVSAFAADAQESATPDSSGTPTVTEPASTGDPARPDCPHDRATDTGTDSGDQSSS
jgi:hypothetical protein